MKDLLRLITYGVVGAALTATCTWEGASAQRLPIGILLVAGDIADCDPNEAEDEATAKVIGREIKQAQSLKIPIRVLALGDLAYPDGTAAEFECFDDTWGQFKQNLLPVPGNHEYRITPKPFFDYAKTLPLVPRSGDRHGYFAVRFPDPNSGPWYLLGLNSNLVGDEDAQQRTWLSNRLQSSNEPCVLAFWHHAVFSSGRHGHGNSEDANAPTVIDPRMQPYWRRLDNKGTSFVLTAHDHDYEQFSPQDADGNADANGLRSFVVGTGGGSLRDQVVYNTKAANSEAYSQEVHGVLKFRLYRGRYKWNFQPIAGDSKIVQPVAGAACGDRP